jgi:hypothetical protein
VHQALDTFAAASGAHQRGASRAAKSSFKCFACDSPTAGASQRQVRFHDEVLSTESSLGDAKSLLGDAESSLGDAKSVPGDAKSVLGGTKSYAEVEITRLSSLGPMNTTTWCW